MGFLENLRRQKELTEAACRQETLRKMAHEERVNEEKKKRNTDKLESALEAKKQFDQSGLMDLIRQLLDIQRGLLFKEDNYSYWVNHPTEYFEGRSHDCQIFLETETNVERRRTRWVEKYIHIKTTSDGTIEFSGGKNGCSVLYKNKWVNNKNVLEEALGKAYSDPIVTVHEPWSDLNGPGIGSY